MDTLRAGWTSFRRIHIAALIADWHRTLLSVIGVALGVTVVLAVLILKSELVRPFDAFGPALTHAADAGVLEVTPNVSGRLPVQTVDRLHSEVAGTVIPVVAGLTPVDMPRGSHGFFLLGGSCQIERLVGPFDCERRARDLTPAAGPGIPLQIPAAIADRHGLHLGDEVRIPGLPPGSAHLGWTFAEFDRVAGINDGYVLLAPSAEIAAGLLGSPGYVTSAFVVPDPGGEITSLTTEVDQVVAGVATTGPPQPHLPAVFESGAQSLNLVAIAGMIVGILIAVNTILLAVEDRRAVLGTIGAIGARPTGLLGGMLAEAALVGAIGGLVGVPGGFVLGSYLVATFGRSMLAGSGGTIAAHFSPSLLAMGATAGILCGLIAMTGPAVRLMRDGPLASMASAGGVERARRIPVWPLFIGSGLLAASVAVLEIFRHGSLPISMGMNGLTVGLFGLVLVTVWLAPLGAALLIRVLTTAFPAVGRLLSADFRRYALLFAFSAALLAESTSFAIGAYSMQLLGSAQIGEQKARQLPTALLITAQSVLDQRDGQISDPTFQMVSATADGRSVSSRWRSTISSGSSSRLVIGVTPGDWYSTALFVPAGAADSFWHGLHDGQIGLSEIAASRLGAAPGDTVELPTVHGPRRFHVAGIVTPTMVNDAAVGDIVLTSDASARSDWAAVRDQIAVAYPSSTDASAHRDDFRGLDAGLFVYDDDEWRTVATTGISRFLHPFTLAGYVVMVAAGLSLLNVFVLGLVQRQRERAALRAIGVTCEQEQAVIVANAAVLGVLVGGIAVLGGLGLTFLWAMGSPVFYGIAIEWGVEPRALRSAVTAVLVLIAIAAVYPVIHARRLETVEVLRSS
ncbi:FtsX-like permease family protein [Mycobacterium sp. M26]|uniref:ABC transporter permease n=1 Tax=Mycobacterium sp. M26 TaxID=1762962 RepID=UPI00073E50AA|nr:FtsX-like permease family protein [Mycobacterium sp. M26]